MLFNEIFQSIMDDLLNITCEELAIECKLSKSSIGFFRMCESSRLPGKKALNGLIAGIESRIEEKRITVSSEENFRIKAQSILSSYNADELIKGMNQITDIADCVEFLMNNSVVWDKNSIIDTPVQHFDLALSSQTPFFTGRDDEVDFLTNELLNKHKSFYLYGIGGIGKTEIIKAIVNNVLQQAIDNRNLPIKSIYWIVFTNDNDKNSDAAFKENIIKSIMPLTAIDATNRDLLYEKCLSTLLKYKETILLIIDNVEIFTEELKAFLSLLSSIRIIIAGRPIPDIYLTNYFVCKEIKEISMDSCRKLFKAYCPFEATMEAALVDEIIDLADRHTVTVELLAKLIKKQETSIDKFLDTLIECGFNFKFDGEEEEKVSSSHPLMSKEEKIIEQLSKLFNTVKLTDKERDLLIKFSTIPNMQCSYTNAKDLFSLKDRSELISLSNSGWLKMEALSDNKNSWSIHSVIASAVRAAHADILYETCEPFIKRITTVIIRDYNKQNKPRNLLISFSWSISEIFNGKFESIDDVDFLTTLASVYEAIGLKNRALNIYNIALGLSTKFI